MQIAMANGRTFLLPLLSSQLWFIKNLSEKVVVFLCILYNYISVVNTRTANLQLIFCIFGDYCFKFLKVFEKRMMLPQFVRNIAFCNSNKIAVAFYNNICRAL